MKFSIGNKEQLINAFTTGASVVNPAAVTIQEQCIRIKAVIEEDDNSNLKEYIVIESLNTSKCRFINCIRADVIDEGAVNLKASWIPQIVKALKTDVDTLDIELKDNKLCFNLGSLGSIECPVASSQEDFNPTGLSRKDINWKSLCKDNPTITEVLKKGVSYCNKDSLIKLEASKEDCTLQIGAKGLVQDFIFFRSSIEVKEDFEFHLYKDIANAITQLLSSSVLSIYKGERTSGSAFVGEDIYKITCGLAELVFYGVKDTNETYKAQSIFLELPSIYQLEVNYSQLINSLNIQSFGLQQHQDISFSLNEGSLLISGEDKSNPAILSVSSYISAIDNSIWAESISFPNKTLLELINATKANNSLLTLCFKTIEITAEEIDSGEITEIPKNMSYWLVAYPSIAYEGGHPFSILPMSAEL